MAFSTASSLFLFLIINIFVTAVVVVIILVQKSEDHRDIKPSCSSSKKKNDYSYVLTFFQLNA